MRFKMIFISLLTMCTIAILPSSNALPYHHNHCRTDSDCNQSNFYCYESRECVECTNCYSYNRQVSTTTKCAKTKDECGKCLSGMEAVENIDGTFNCQPIFTQITTIHSNSDQNPASTTNNEKLNLMLKIFIPIISIIVFIVCLAVVIRYKIWLVFKQALPFNRNCPDVNDNNKVVPTNPPPPPYSLSPYLDASPSAPPEMKPLIQSRRIIDDENQRANPFHPPNYVNGGSFSDNPPPEVPPNNQENPTADEDEDTQLSVWSPNTQNSDLNQPQNFSNMFSATNPPQNEQFEQPPNQNSNSESSNRNSSVNIQVYVNTTNLNNMQVINEI